MKPTVFLSLILVGLAAGCGNESASSSSASTEQTNGSAAQADTNSSGAGVITAPVDYLGVLAKAKQRAVKTTDLAQINQAIQVFQTEKGRYPKSLDELVQDKYLAGIPAAPYGTKLVYNPATGQVSVVNK